MIRPPPRSTRPDTLFPYTTLFRSLSYIAGRTKRVKLGIGAAILPWNDPLRIAEKSILLDHLSGGRAIIALGRGLAKAEYDAFGIDMNESRGRFNESADMVINALSSGVIEGKGPHYPQLKTTLRPAPSPERPWDDRLFAAAMRSEEHTSELQSLMRTSYAVF